MLLKKCTYIIPLPKIKRFFGYVSDYDILGSMLQGYKKSMKKPTDVMKNGEQILFKKILPFDVGIQMPSQNDMLKINNVADYLIGLRGFKFLSINSLDLIEQWVTQQWKYLNQNSKIGILCFLVQQGRYNVFQIFNNQLISQKFQNSRQKTTRIEFKDMIYTYCKCIVNKNLDSLSQLHSEKQLQPQQLAPYHPKWKDQIDLFTKAYHSISLKQGIVLYSLQNRREKKKNRSILQIEIQALLKTKGYQFERQFNIMGFNVDFIVDHKVMDSGEEAKLEDRLVEKIKRIRDGQFVNQGGKMKESVCFLEVMGWHHYTVENRLFGRDLFRVMILDRIFPVGMVHSCDLNQIKGVQNRLTYLQQIIKSTNSKNRQQKDKGWIPKQQQYAINK